MITFDNSIYSITALEQACQDFHDLAHFSITEGDGIYICDVQEPKGDPAMICNEFSNYVLILSVMIGRVKN